MRGTAEIKRQVLVLNLFDNKNTMTAEKAELKRYHEPAKVDESNAPFMNETQVSVWLIPGRISLR